MQYIALSLPWVLNTCDNPEEVSELQGYYRGSIPSMHCRCAGSKSLSAGYCLWLMSNNEEVRPFVECAIRLL